jgi:hypothetical protein
VQALGHGCEHIVVEEPEVEDRGEQVEEAVAAARHVGSLDWILDRPDSN